MRWQNGSGEADGDRDDGVEREGTMTAMASA